MKGSRPATANPADLASYNGNGVDNESEARKKFEKFGYSKNEVWNWLYTDKEEEEAAEAEAERERLSKLYSVPQKINNSGTKTVEVKFTPQEFFDSSSRLAHLDIDGMDRFVGNTLEKALVKRRRRQQKEEAAVAAAVAAADEATNQAVNVDDKSVTITEVPGHSLDVLQQTNNGCGEPGERLRTCVGNGATNGGSAHQATRIYYVN